MYQMLIRLYQLFIAGTLQILGVLPSTADTVSAAAVTVTASASAWTWGSYAQIVSAAGNTSVSKVVGLTLENFVVANNAAIQGEIQIATGGSGSEVVFATVPITSDFYSFPFSQMIQSGTRIAARLRTSGTTAATIDVKLQTLTGTNIFS